MRLTLRRSCNACVRSKLSCDLRSPQCSRCAKKKATCVYANQPLTLSTPNASLSPSQVTGSEVSGPLIPCQKSPVSLFTPLDSSLDPFNSYPRTKLARTHEQRLIQHFLSNIAFQYYPLDLDASSNPFIVSWWPLALSDPALFHVSLQTASLDIDARDQKGFTNSEILMADSVSLVRRRIESPSLAIQDATMDSVVTLAAIEYGKGQAEIGKMHIGGMINMVHLRGGIQKVRLTSPLTARMVSWVSLILTQTPQFPTQDDSGAGDGIAPIAQWSEVGKFSPNARLTSLDDLDMDPTTSETLWRLRHLLNGSDSSTLSATDFHDLTCFVLHRMLGQSNMADPEDVPQAPCLPECIRNGVVLYMLIIHGPTYFSHAGLQHKSLQYLRARLAHLLPPLLHSHASVALWLLSVCMVASADEDELQWFCGHARAAIEILGLCAWEPVFASLQTVLWFHQWQAERLFRECWTAVFEAEAHDNPPQLLDGTGTLGRLVSDARRPLHANKDMGGFVASTTIGLDSG